MRYFLLLRYLIVPLIVLEVFIMDQYYPWQTYITTLVLVSVAVDWWLTTRNVGVLIAAFGGALNRAAMIANGGYMPVGGGLLKAPTHKYIPLTTSSNLPWLTDIHDGASKGDFIATVGLIVVAAIWAYRKWLRSH